MSTIPQELVSKIAFRHCCLFAGAGLTANYGGATWAEFVAFLVERFKYAGPYKRGFQVVSDICRINGDAPVYAAVQERLGHVCIEEPVSLLADLNWFTAFTTNYDSGLEDALNKAGRFQIQTVLTGDEFALAGIPSQIVCVKLMGDVHQQMGSPGAMVLTSHDLTVARERRGRTFDELCKHAANLAFLFLGYSFDDELFMEALERIEPAAGHRTNRYYAVFREQPTDPERVYALQEQYGISVIVADLPDFCQQLYREVIKLQPSSTDSILMHVGNSTVPVSARRISAVLKAFSPVTYDRRYQTVELNDFLRGRSTSLKPFAEGWHFPRRQTKHVVDAVLSHTSSAAPRIVAVEGTLGSGRSFAILDAVLQLLENYNSLCINLAGPGVDAFTVTSQLLEFQQAVTDSCAHSSVPPPERLVLWAEYPPDIADLSRFLGQGATEIPTVLIFEQFVSYTPPSMEQRLTRVDMNADIEPEEARSLAQYLVRVTASLDRAKMTTEDAEAIIAQDKLLMPILYRTLDPARRSIQSMVTAEFGETKDAVLRDCIALTALTSSKEVEMPLSLLRAALGRRNNRRLRYEDVYIIASTLTCAFIRVVDKGLEDYEASIYHPLIAQHILDLLGKDGADELLLSLSQVFDLRDPSDSNVARAMLITHGVNRGFGYSPFSDKALLQALKDIVKRQPARPMLHHLGRLQWKMDEREDAITTLMRAIKDPVERFVPQERRENVLTTLAQLLWLRDKDKLLAQPRSSSGFREILALLEGAEFSIGPNGHAFDVHFRILREIWHTKSNGEKLQVVTQALDVVDQGLSRCADDFETVQRLSELRTEALNEIDHRLALEYAEELLAGAKDGSGFYVIARKLLDKNRQDEDGLKYLNTAMTGLATSPTVFVFHIEFELDNEQPDYEALARSVRRIARDGRYHDNWLVSYRNAVVFFISRDYASAAGAFRSSRNAPHWVFHRPVLYFWQENGRHREFRGRIAQMTAREGYLAFTDIPGFKEPVYFQTQKQTSIQSLDTGMEVYFYLGFSKRGPIAFEIQTTQHYPASDPVDY